VAFEDRYYGGVTQALELLYAQRHRDLDGRGEPPRMALSPTAALPAYRMVLRQGQRAESAAATDRRWPLSRGLRSRFCERLETLPLPVRMHDWGLEYDARVQGIYPSGCRRVPPRRSLEQLDNDASVMGGSLEWESMYLVHHASRTA